MRRPPALLLAACCALGAAPPEPAPPSAEDARVLARVGLPDEGPALLDYFRRRTPTAANRARARELVGQLAGDSFAGRQQASVALTAMGSAAAPALNEAARSADPEVRRRAADCLATLGSPSAQAADAAAARRLAARRPAGAAGTLLAYLPAVGDEQLAEELRAALDGLAAAGGGPDPGLIAGLADRDPAVRAEAGVALCRAGRGAVARPLLRDPDAGVRFRAAVALTEAGERAAVPGLIEAVDEGPADRGWAADTLLRRLAGERAPAADPGGDAAARAACRDAWRAWWRDHGARADLAGLAAAPPVLGYTLAVLLDTGQVVEFDKGGRTRWQLGGLEAPLDAQALPGGRVLVAEHKTRRVSERDHAGKVLWEKVLDAPPVHVERLPGGGTLVVTANAVLEVSRAGREAVRYRPAAAGTLLTARRHPDGRLGCVLSGGTYLLLGSSGKELRRFPIGDGVHTTNALTVLPGNRILIAEYGGGSVREYDGAGRVGWEAKVNRPLSAVRLPNGNTLVSSQDCVLVECDRAGKEVGRRPVLGHPCQIHYR
jgi:HEAT repeat protein